MQAPDDLRARGLQFWHEVTVAVKMDAAGLVLLGEACRTLDRLDRLSDALNGSGRDWLKIADEVEEIGRGKVKVQVVVDGLLSEGRQQQLALKSVLAQLKLGNVSEEVAEASPLAAWLASRTAGA